MSYLISPSLTSFLPYLQMELKVEVERLTTELGRVSAAEEMLRSKLSSRDRKIAFLEEQMESKPHHIDPGVFAEDMDSIREKLTSLRTGLLPSDPQQHVIDLLEKNISDTIGKMSEHSHSLSPARRPRRHVSPNQQPLVIVNKPGCCRGNLMLSRQQCGCQGSLVLAWRRPGRGDNSLHLFLLVICTLKLRQYNLVG